MYILDVRWSDQLTSNSYHLICDCRSVAQQFLNVSYICFAKWFIFSFTPVGDFDCSLQIHLSSCCSRWARDFERPVCRICTSRSSRLWFLWKWLASSLLSGLDFMSCLCLANLSAREQPVSPTYTILHFLQVAAYISCVDLQLPPSLTLMVIPFCGLVMVSDVRMFLQRAHFLPQGLVTLGGGSFIGLLFTTWFFIDFGRLNATMGRLVKTLAVETSFSKRWK